MAYIIVDFEATCCDKGTVARNEMEIIEIGAVALEGDALRILDEFQSFVKPIRNTVLTHFCKELTSITQEMVDTANPFPLVIDDFSRWLQSFKDPIFCSWGNYDKNQLKQDCDFHQTPFPFNEDHINIKQQFAKNMGIKKALGLGRALKFVDLTFSGTAHRGIDDARNMARLAKYIFTTK